ncbi:MAG: clostripain-related cysteine peptidase [bacterium]|nr:clostripain-related cysteine peptidase [bacterium]
MRKLIFAAVLTAFCFSLTETIKAEATTKKANKPWTILIFLNGDNDLESAAINDVNEMERGVDTSKYNVIIELDRFPIGEVSNSNWTDTRVFYITPDPSTDRTIRSPRIDSLGEANMGDPNTLIDFVKKGIQNYPADNYMLIIWDHGSGWLKKGNHLSSKGVSYDETSDDEMGVANGEYAYAMDSISTLLGKKLDILANDACLMGMYEVAYEVKDNVNYIVFSEYDMAGDGYPYDDILNWLNVNPNATPEELSKAIVDKQVASYNGGSQGTQNVTLSALKLDDKFLHVARCIDTFAVELMEINGRNNINIETAYTETQCFNNAWLYSYDIYDFAYNIKQSGSIPDSVKNWADSVMLAIDSAVINEGHYSIPSALLEGSYGLAIYYPVGYNIDTTYKNLTVSKDFPNWRNFIKGDTIIGVEEQSILVPPRLRRIASLQLLKGKICLSVPKVTEANIKIYDLCGRMKEVVYTGILDKGDYSFTPGIHKSGVYFVRLETNSGSYSQKLIIAR